jgi:hypothetical protein
MPSRKELIKGQMNSLHRSLSFEIEFIYHTFFEQFCDLPHNNRTIRLNSPHIYRTIQKIPPHMTAQFAIFGKCGTA